MTLKNRATVRLMPSLSQDVLIHYCDRLELHDEHSIRVEPKLVNMIRGWINVGQRFDHARRKVMAKEKFHALTTIKRFQGLRQKQDRREYLLRLSKENPQALPVASYRVR